MSKFDTIDNQLDQLVDTRQISYTEAYGVLGLPVPPTAPISADATAARIKDHDFFTQEFGLTGKPDRTPEEQLEQQQRDHLGATAVMAALHEAKNKS